MMRRLAPIALVALLTTGGCNRSASSPNNAAAPAQPGSPRAANTTAVRAESSALDVDSANHRMLAAAEPFENLTEQAFSASGPALDKLIADARAAGLAMLPPMSPAAAGQLRGQLDAIDVARKSDDRAKIALAAVEGYRTLVSSTTEMLVVPRQVSLLDYAGFRIQADLKARPQRWTDIADAAAFATDRWHEIAGQVADAPLARQMDATLSEVETASRSKDPARLLRSSTAQLDLVDRLEQYFTARHRRASKP